MNSDCQSNSKKYIYGSPYSDLQGDRSGSIYAQSAGYPGRFYTLRYPFLFGGGYDGPCFPADAEQTKSCLRVIYVCPSMVCAGIEQWLAGLIRFSMPSRLRTERCIICYPEMLDPRMAARLGVPVEVGKCESVRRAVQDCDVLVACGPAELGEWLADCRPKLSILVAHGEGEWTRSVLEGCANVVDHVVAVSNRAQQRVCYDIPCTVIPNGIDSVHIACSRSRAQVRHELGFAAEDFVLGFVGRYSPEKNPSAPIEAIAGLSPRFKALMLGWGPLEEELRGLAETMAPGRVRFVAATSYLGDYYHAMDAFCLPSYEEGNSLALLEAMMCQRPVLATPVGAAPDIIVDGVSGIFIDGKPAAIQAATNRLATHPAWARGIAAEARAWADEFAHARHMAAGYETLLHSLWREKFGPAA
ncbi:MAG TPA: glycosyltransferase [Pirellulales bacterium]|nr:glycosyltransferase [Pirellulales bacterium]